MADGDNGTVVRANTVHEALDTAFDVAAFKNRPTSRPDADELRTLVRMVRCASAHNPAHAV